MKRPIIPALLLAFLFAAAFAATQPSAPRPKLFIYVSTVMWQNDAGFQVASFVGTGTDPDVMTPIVTNNLAAANPKGYVLLSLKTSPVSDDIVEQIVANRAPSKNTGVRL